MTQLNATAVANANIAFIKYWGNRDEQLRLPSTGSISMNLDSLVARTRVSYEANLLQDTLTLNGHRVSGPALERVQFFQELVRKMAGVQQYANVTSENNFPTGAGIASSAAAFAALALASTSAIGLNLSEPELSRLARRGSGSACRSIPGGFVEWSGNEDSYAGAIANPDSWNLVDCIAIINEQPKKVGSSAGHTLAATSPFQAERVASSTQRLDICRRAILDRDFFCLAKISELDCQMMHAVMMTSQPPLFYWAPASITVMQAVLAWRKKGLAAFYTLDAGANVHVICTSEAAGQVGQLLSQLPGVLRILTSAPGVGAKIINDNNL